MTIKGKMEKRKGKRKKVLMPSEERKRKTKSRVGVGKYVVKKEI